MQYSHVGWHMQWHIQCILYTVHGCHSLVQPEPRGAPPSEIISELEVGGTPPKYCFGHLLTPRNLRGRSVTVGATNRVMWAQASPCHRTAGLHADSFNRTACSSPILRRRRKSVGHRPHTVLLLVLSGWAACASAPYYASSVQLLRPCYWVQCSPSNV